MKIGLLAILGVLLATLPAVAFDAESSCVKCHGDREKMNQIGYPQLYLDPVQVDEEVAMAGIPTCVDCHLGDSAAMDKGAAPVPPGTPTPIPMMSASPSAVHIQSKRLVTGCSSPTLPIRKSSRWKGGKCRTSLLLSQSNLIRR